MELRLYGSKPVPGRPMMQRRTFLAAVTATVAPVVRIGALHGPQAVLMARAVQANPGFRLIETMDRDALMRDLAHGTIDASASHTSQEIRALPVNDGRIVPAFATVTLPFGIYSHRVRSITQLRDGDLLVLPNIKSGYDRARVLLYNYGLLFAHEDDGLNADFSSIVNPRKFTLVTDDPWRLAARLADAAAVVMPYETAVGAELRPSIDSIGLEDGKSPYAQMVAVRQADIGKPWLRLLASSFQSRAIRRFIYAQFGDSVEPPW